MPMNQVLHIDRIFGKREILTPSELVAFLTCRKLHDYRYKHLLVPKEENERLALWKAINRGLSAWYDSFDKAKALAAVEESLRESHLESQLLSLASGMLEGYIEHWKRRDNFKVLHVDLPFLTPLVTPSGRASRILDLAGMVPLVIEKPDGSIWIVIHRVVARKDPNYFERLETDIRIRSCCWALNRYLDSGVAGVIVNVLRAKLPFEPEILKNGTVSKRANIDTTLEVFTAALNRTGSNPADYAEIIERLAKEDDSFFMRWERVYLPEEMGRTARDLYLISRDMRRAGRERPYGNPNSCTSYGLCPYRALCAGGFDSDETNTAYQRLESRHPALAGVDLDSLRSASRRGRKFASRGASRSVANAAYVQ